MAHTNCPNGHDMWNGDMKPVLWVYSVDFFRKLCKEKIWLTISERWGDYYDMLSEYPEVEMDCWLCPKCKGLAVFYNYDDGKGEFIYRYDYKPMKKIKQMNIEYVKKWPQYIAMRETEYEDFQDYSEGKTPIIAIENYGFKTFYYLSPDKHTIYGITDNKITIGYYMSKKYIFLKKNERTKKKKIETPYFDILGIKVGFNETEGQLSTKIEVKGKEIDKETIKKIKKQIEIDKHKEIEKQMAEEAERMMAEIDTDKIAKEVIEKISIIDEGIE